MLADRLLARETRFGYKSRAAHSATDSTDATTSAQIPVSALKLNYVLLNHNMVVAALGKGTAVRSQHCPESTRTTGLSRQWFERLFVCLFFPFPIPSS